MSDEFDDIKRVLGASPPPPPDPNAIAAARAAAMAAFDNAADMDMAVAADRAATPDGAGVSTQNDTAGNADTHGISTQDATPENTAPEKNVVTRQGSVEAPRQRVRQSGLMTLFRRLSMNLPLPSTKTLMMGGASLAVLTLAIFAVQNQQPSRTYSPGVGGLMTMGGGSTEARRDESIQLDRLRQQPEAKPEVAAPSADREALAEEVAKAPFLAEPAPAPMPQAEMADAVRAPKPGQPSNRLQSASKKHAAPNNLAAGQAQPLGLGQTYSLDQPEADRRQPGYKDQGRDKFEDVEPNPVKITGKEPVSTFSVDVDTASYAYMRKALNNGILPQKDSVRVEELINYFPYDYALPESRETPFSTDVSLMPTPWNEGTKLMRIGIKGYELAPAEKPRSNLVFLLDTSGSMNAPDKLPLLINSFRLLVDSLDADDTVSIVVYAGSAGTVLEPTKVADKGKILSALDRLRAGGSTAGGEGIRQAYALAEQNFDEDGINRVILATDGDFNVGIRNPEELKDFVERKRDTGVFLSVLGFGRGNYNDALMQTLAQNGNGNAAYIDTLNEARKTLVQEASSTLFPIAKDVKIQVEFNPATVAEYRLIGYETRVLAREDFNNDAVDAGEIGAGHTVTALYEVTPVGSDARLFDELRFEQTQEPAETETAWTGEIAFVRLRYKQPDAEASRLIEVPVVSAEDEAAPGTEARFAAAVAAYGQLLTGGKYTGTYTYDDVIDLATGAKGADPFGYRAEFVNLVRLAKSAGAMDRQ